MGIIFSIFKIILGFIFKDERIKICFLGPEQSGKTSLMFYYNNKEKVFTIPTRGYNSDIYKFKNKEFIFWDVGASYIKAWPGFIEGADFLFFVIDSSCINSINSARELLYQIYFGKRFRNFLENYKEKEKIANSRYFFEDEEDDRSSLNSENYVNLIKEESDYERVLKDKKMFESDGTETDKGCQIDVIYLLFIFIHLEAIKFIF